MYNKNKAFSIIKIFFPIIFGLYFVSISYFPHTHIVDGISIVHSHPFVKDEGGKPGHEHSTSEIRLIHQLSTFHFGGFFVLFALVYLAHWSKLLFEKNLLSAIHKAFTGLCTTRPPPTLQF